MAGVHTFDFDGLVKTDLIQTTSQVKWVLEKCPDVGPPACNANLDHGFVIFKQKMLLSCWKCVRFAALNRRLQRVHWLSLVCYVCMFAPRLPGQRVPTHQ